MKQPRLFKGSLQAAVEDAASRSLSHRRVLYLHEKQTLKEIYAPGAGIKTNHSVKIFGHEATCVGITSLATSPDHQRILVSDSFASCVPVIAIGRTGTHLAHFNGIGLVEECAAV